MQNIVVEKELWRLFWINKYGYYPTKLEKVGRAVTIEQFNREKEGLELEFQKFVKEYANK